MNERFSNKGDKMNTYVGTLNQMIHKLVPLTFGVMLFFVPLSVMAQENSEASAAKVTVMSKDLLDGISLDAGTPKLHVQGGLRSLEGEGLFESLFRLDASYADSVAPASELQKIGVVPTGTATFTLPDGTVGEFAYGIARIEVLGEMKESRIIFGPEDVESVLGVNALQAIGFSVDAATHSLSRISEN